LDGLRNCISYSSHSGLPGLIFAATPALLEDVCRCQISKLRSGRKVNPQRIFIYPTLNFSSFSRGLDIFISGQEATRDLLPQLASGASILSIVGHSDGISLDISHRSALCPFVSSPAMEGEFRPRVRSWDDARNFRFSLQWRKHRPRVGFYPCILYGQK
jgi:hypothetical protein